MKTTILLIIIGLLFTGCSNDLPRGNVDDTASEAWYMARKALHIAQQNQDEIESMRNR